MPLTLPLGVGIGIAIVFFAILSGAGSAAAFLNPHSAFIVLGGTVAAIFTCFPKTQLLRLYNAFLVALRGQKHQEVLETINEITRLAEVQHDERPLSQEMESIKNPFLKEALQLSEESGLANDEFEEILIKRVELQNEKYRRDSTLFKTIGKFPPAFGLIGTTMGMVTLLRGLGEANAFDSLGQSMSMALVATFYGLVLTNIFFLPLGENLLQTSETDLCMRRVVVDGMRLLRDRKHPIIVREHLQSYLLPNERLQMTGT